MKVKNLGQLIGGFFIGLIIGLLLIAVIGWAWQTITGTEILFPSKLKA